MTSLHFYEELPVYESLEAVIREAAFENVPDDWWLLTADIKGSTTVIAAGGYRNVVTLGTATIIAALNSLNGVEVPFRFGGDGSVICIPDMFIDPVLANLSALQREARERFGIYIRCGAVSVGALRKDGYEVLVGRYRLSDHNVLAVFSGGGFDQADLIVKGRASGTVRTPQVSQETDLRLDGLECRWKPLHSRKGNFISLIVVPLGENRKDRIEHLEEVFTLLLSLYGEDQIMNPVDSAELELGVSSKYLQSELRIRARKNTWIARLRQLITLKLTVLVGKVVMAQKIKVNGFDWGTYKTDLVQNIDNRSFADIYSHVFPGSDEQHGRLEEQLNVKCGEGKILFGMHTSDHALFTCHITQYAGKHLHFLDGGNGGLTLAAKNMKLKTAMNSTDTARAG